MFPIQAVRFMANNNWRGPIQNFSYVKNAFTCRTFITTVSRRNCVVREQSKNPLLIPRRITANPALRFMTTEVPKKGQKLVGGWLLGCSGMVFVAVVLGATFCYIFLVYSVCFVIGIIISVVSKGA